MVRDNVTHLFLGADVAQNATGMADIDAGEIIAIGVGGAKLSAAEISNLGDNEPFYLVEGKRGTNLSHIISPRLTKGSIKAHRGTSYAAAVEQVSYIGNVGSGTEDINVENETEYSVVVSFVWDKDIYSKRHDVKHYNYTSDASATSNEIATNLVALMNADADFAAQATAAVTNNGADYGISITGKAQTGNDYDNPSQVIFKIALDKGFDATTQVDEFGYTFKNGTKSSGGASVSPTPGVGTSALIKAFERNNDGFQNGVTNNTKFPVIGPDARVSATGTYDVYVIDFVDTHENKNVGIGETRSAAQQIVIANDISTTVNSTTATLEALLLAITGVAVNL